MEGELVYKFPAENGGEVERRFFFGNYALEKVLEDFDVSITDINELLQKKLLAVLRAFMYYGACYPILERKETPDFDAFDVHKWIDQAGGSSGELMTLASKELFRALGMTEGEKKSEVKAKKK